jgi:hypothetical protein
MKNISPSPSIPQTPKYLALFIPYLNFDPTNQVILQENSKKEMSLSSKKDPRKKRKREKERSEDQRAKEEKTHLQDKGMKSSKEKKRG